MAMQNSSPDGLQQAVVTNHLLYATVLQTGERSPLGPSVSDRGHSREMDFHHVNQMRTSSGVRFFADAPMTDRWSAIWPRQAMHTNVAA